ncbi:MAG: proline--tRNA ligase [Geminicoccaceae bacterium]
MRLSRYFLPVLKETPAEAQIVSHQLMLRAGMIQQLAAGIYSWLPLGYAVLRKVESIVHEEMQRAGAIPILMPTIQPADLWIESGRYDDYGKEMLRIQDRHERGMLYGPTNEENVTDIFRRHVRSFKQLPLNLYHIQWKFRDEVRPRFGVMRGREFLMKDAYSFDLDAAGAQAAYDTMFLAYLRTFRRMGLTAIPMQADTGPIGGDMSHEFHLNSRQDRRERGIHFDAAFKAIDFFGRRPLVTELKALYAAADDKHDPAVCPVPAERLYAAAAASRSATSLFGASIPRSHGGHRDRPRRCHAAGAHGLLRHRRVAAGRCAHRGQPRRQGHHLARGRGTVQGRHRRSAAGRCALHGPAEELHERLQRAGVDVLDERDERARAKFATMELIGLPWTVTVGPRGAKEGKVELKARASGEAVELDPDALVQRLTA